MTAWIWLFAAIVTEVLGTTALKHTEGFTNWVPSVIVVVCYMNSFYCMSMALKTMEMSTMYAIWSGLGVALITAVGFFFYQESMNWAKGFSLALIVAGVVGLRLSSEVAPS